MREGIRSAMGVEKLASEIVLRETGLRTGVLVLNSDLPCGRLAV